MKRMFGTSPSPPLRGPSARPAGRGSSSSFSPLVGEKVAAGRMRGFAFLALLLAAACHRASTDEAAQPVVSVRVAKAEIGSIAQPLELVGTVTARQEAAISSKIGAQIAHMPLLKNRVGGAGDVLADIQGRDLGAQRNQDAARLPPPK